MTRCDLDQVIGDLQYLVQHCDPGEIEGYYQQLQGFQQELRDRDELTVLRTSPAPSSSRN